MSNTANNILPISVPKLDMSRTNQAIFVLYFQTVVQEKELWEYFDSSMSCPVLSSPVQSLSAILVAAPSTTSTSTIITSNVTQESIDVQNQNESITCSLLAQHLPDSTFVIVVSYVSVKSIQDAITKDHTYKSIFSQVCLYYKFTNVCYPEKGDIYVFLNNLYTKKAELSTVGININDDNYQNSIIQFLPSWLATFASNQLTATYLTCYDIEPKLLITIICDKQDHTHPSGRGSSQHDVDNVLAFEINSKEKKKEKQKDKEKERKKKLCWIYGSDHLKKKCPKQKDRKDKNNNSSSNTKLLGTSINTMEKDKDYGFMTKEVSDNEEIMDKFYFEGKFVRELEDWLDHEELTIKEVVSVELTTTQIEVFDSDATTHITLYKDNFFTFQSTVPKVL